MTPWPKIIPADFGHLDQIRDLFRQTVLISNSVDYNEEQISAWASAADNKERWVQKIESQYFLVAVFEKGIGGIASLEPGGYLDLFYVHPAYQRKKVGQKLL